MIDITRSVIRIVLPLILSFQSNTVLSQVTKPYDRTKWFDSNAVTTDDLRRVPQSKGYGDHEDKIVIVGGRLFDGTGSSVRLATIILEGKTITRIIDADDTNYPIEAEIIDASGKTVMPGLIDLHVHTTYVKQFPPSELSTKSQADAALRGFERLRYFIESGITSVRDVASHGFAPFILNSYFRENILPGPRIFAAGQLITSRGGHGAEGGLKIAPDYPDASIRIATGVDEWINAVRLQFNNGADLIKLSSHYTPQEIKAAIEEAHRLGLRVTVDAETQYIDMAVEAGADCIEHPLPRSDKTIKLMKKYNVAAVPTLVPYQLINRDGGYMGSTSRRFTLTDETIMNTMKKMRKAGIKMGVATDITASLYKYMPAPYIIELNNLKLAGYSNIEALVAATKTNSEILGMDDRLGTIEVGKLADVIIINGKPDESIEDIANVETVIINGKVKVRNGNIVMPPLKKESLPSGVGCTWCPE